MDVVLSRQEQPDYENVLDVNEDDDNNGRVRFINDDLNRENLHFRLSEALIQTLEAQKPGMPSSSFDHLFDTSEDPPPPHSTFAVFLPTTLPKHQYFPEEGEESEGGAEEDQRGGGRPGQPLHPQRPHQEGSHQRQPQRAPGQPTAGIACDKAEAGEPEGENHSRVSPRPRNDTATTSTSTATSACVAPERAASAQSMGDVQLGALGDLEENTQDESQEEAGLIGSHSCDDAQTVEGSAPVTSPRPWAATAGAGARRGEIGGSDAAILPSSSPRATTEVTAPSPTFSDNRRLLRESSSLLDTSTVSAPLHRSTRRTSTHRARDASTTSEASSSPAVSLSPIRSFARSRGTSPPPTTALTSSGGGDGGGSLPSKYWQRRSAYNPAAPRKHRSGHTRSSSLAGLTTALSQSTPVTPTKPQRAINGGSYKERGSNAAAAAGGGGSDPRAAVAMLRSGEEEATPARARSTTFSTPPIRRKHSSVASTTQSPLSRRGSQQQWRGTVRGRSTSPESVVLGILQSMLDDQEVIQDEHGDESEHHDDDDGDDDDDDDADEDNADDDDDDDDDEYGDGACGDSDDAGDAGEHNADTGSARGCAVGGGGAQTTSAGGSARLNRNTSSRRNNSNSDDNNKSGSARRGRSRTGQRRGRGAESTTSSGRLSSTGRPDLSSHQPLVEGELASLPQRPLRQPSINLRDLRKSQQQLRDIWQPSIRGNDHWAPPRHQVIYHVNDRSAMLKSEAMERQGFRCYNCGLKVELKHLYHKFRWCEYTGKYFCTSCHKLDKAYIPARILASWDFRRYPISKFAAGVLISIKDTPVFDVQALNPRLVRRVTPLRKVIQLRTRLKSLRDYLAVCRLGQPLLAMVEANNSNLVLAASTFSLMQLIKVRSGQMYKDLKALCKAWEEHVMGCSLCLAKAHICEFCNNDRDLLFPFQTRRVHKCPECKAISHIKCYAKRKTCPRCERRRRYRNSTVSAASMSSVA